MASSSHVGHPHSSPIRGESENPYPISTFSREGIPVISRINTVPFPPLAYCHRESENYFGKDVLGTCWISPLALPGESENYLSSSEWRLGYDARLLIRHT